MKTNCKELEKDLPEEVQRRTTRREAYESHLSEEVEDAAYREARGAIRGLIPQRQIYSGFSAINTLVADVIPFDAAKMVASLKEQMTEANVVGFSYAIVRVGQLVTAGGEGWARAPWESQQASVPMTETKRMTIASISKPITAVATMHLIENSDLSVDDPFYPLISESFPDVHPSVETMTIRQLLTHKTGLDYNCKLDKDDPDRVCYGCGELEELLAQGSEGVFYYYRNAHFCLLRQVIEHVTGQGYVAYVQANVLNPMTITNMSCGPDADQPTLYYSTYYQPEGYLWGGYASSCSAYGWYASAINLAKFLAFVRYNQVLSQSTTNQMLTEGLGWQKYYGSRGTYYGHGGDWIAPGLPQSDPDLGSFAIETPPKRGFTGAIMHFPDLVDAVLLVNTRGHFNSRQVLKKAYEAAYE